MNWLGGGYRWAWCSMCLARSVPEPMAGCRGWYEAGSAMIGLPIASNFCSSWAKADSSCCASPGYPAASGSASASACSAWSASASPSACASASGYSISCLSLSILP